MFSAGGRDYHWSDVIAAARVRGDWAVFERRVSAFVPGAGRLSMDEWRRERGLLSADETVAWLTRWGLEIADVRRHLGTGDAPGGLSAGDLERAAWAEAVCSDALSGLAWGLAAPVALSADPPGAGSSLDSSAFAGLDAEFEHWRAGVEASDAVVPLIEANAAAWASVAVQMLTFSELEAAREAVLCIRCDGLSVAEVAELSGGELTELSGMLDELGEPARGLVASALAGELVGPFANAGAYQVLQLVSKQSPRMDDPAVLARARALAVTRAIDRASAVRIVWHDRL